MGICINGVSRASARLTNGKLSKLFNDMVAAVGKTKAVDYYALINTTTFKRDVYDWTTDVDNLDVNGEPKLEIISKYINEYNSKTKQQAVNSTTVNDQAPIDNNYELDNQTASYINLTEIVEDPTIIEPADEETDVKKVVKARNKDRRFILLETKRNQINELKVTLTALKGSNKKEDIVEYNRIINRINKLSLELHTAEEMREASIEDIVDIANKDLSKVNDILNMKNPTIRDIEFANYVLDVWQDTREIFLIGAERSMKRYTNTEYDTAGILDVESNARSLKDRLIEKQHILIRDLTKEINESDKVRYNELTIKDEFEAMSDVNMLYANVMHVGRIGSSVTDMMERINLMGQMKISRKIDVMFKEIDEITKGIKDYTFLQEKYADGTATGRLVGRFMPEFRDAWESIKYNNFNSETKKDKRKTILEWQHENTIMFDPRVFFADIKYNGKKVFEGFRNLNYDITDNIRDKAEQEKLLKEILNEDYDINYKRAKELILDYAKQRDAYITSLNEYLDNGRITQEIFNDLLDKWEVQNSPFVYAYNVTTGSSLIVNGISYYADAELKVKSFPRKYKIDLNGDTLNIETGWFNKDYNRIVNNPKYKTILKYVSELNHQMKLILPDNVAANIDDNFLMQVKKGVVKSIMDNPSGIKSGIFDKVLTLIAKQEQLITSHVDKHTGKVKYRATVAGVKGYQAVFNELLGQKLINFEAINNRKPNEDDVAALRKETRQELQAGYAFDINDALKLWVYQVQQFKHVAEWGQVMQSVRDVVSSVKEVKYKDQEGNSRKVSQEDSFRNIKDMINYFIDSFYGYDKYDPKFNKKIKNSEDKRQQDGLDEALGAITKNYADGIINEETYETLKNKILEFQNKLGQVVSIDQIGRSILSYTQFKGMGFNAPAAITNMMQGYINNMIEANDGRLFNRKELLAGYRDIFGSVVKFATFNAITTPTATKVRNITDSYDLLSESSRELSRNKSLKKKNILTDFYRLQNRSEFINQAPIILAMLRKHKVTVIENGKEVTYSLYELMDEKGNLRTDVDYMGKDYVDENGDMGKDLLNEMIKIAKAITIVHGNYNRHLYLRANKNVWMSALKQFRTWMFEAFAQRLEKNKYDTTLGMTRKGRWNSGFGMFTFNKFNNPNLTQEQGYDSSWVRANLFTMGQFLKEMVFLRANLDTKFNAVDAANLRKNFAEMRFILNTMLFMFAIGAVAGGDDDDEEMIRRATVNYLFNTTNRLMNDMSLYFSPVAFENILKNPIPAFATIAEIGDLFAKFGLWLAGKDEIQGGLYDGESKFFRSLSRQIPIFNRIQSVRSMSSQIFNKGKGLTGTTTSIAKPTKQTKKSNNNLNNEFVIVDND